MSDITRDSISSTQVKNVISLCMCPGEDCIYKCERISQDGEKEFGTEYEIKQSSILGKMVRLCGKFESYKKHNPDSTLYRYLKNCNEKDRFCEQEKIFKPEWRQIDVEIHDI